MRLQKNNFPFQIKNAHIYFDVQVKQIEILACCQAAQTSKKPSKCEVASIWLGSPKSCISTKSREIAVETRVCSILEIVKASESRQISWKPGIRAWQSISSSTQDFENSRNPWIWMDFAVCAVKKRLPIESKIWNVPKSLANLLKTSAKELNQEK